MTYDIGGYRVADIAISAAFDITTAKVGREVAEAIFAHRTIRPDLLRLHLPACVINRGKTCDGLGRYLREELQESDAPLADVADILRRTGTEVLVSYLPVGSQQATEWYAERALEAGCAFVNCIPVFIASNCDWRDASRPAACR